MIISLTEKSKKYAKVVFDVSRIFLPKLTWHQLMGEGLSHYSLDIEISGENLRVSLIADNRTQDSYSAAIKINETNEIKRTIKLAVYHILKNLLQVSGSPWGILTGIRPTKIVHRLWDQGYQGLEIERILRENYLVDVTKIKNLLEITTLQRQFLLSPEDSSKTASIYISIPFCPTRCYYCSFPAFSIGRWEKEVDNYLQALKMETFKVGEALKEKGIDVETIYVGGGTPTSLDSQQLTVLLDAINSSLRTNKTREFTVEAGRPDTITEDKLWALKYGAVDRISINPQTMWAPTLINIGRAHTTEDVINKVEMARKIGFKVINMDLILGLPGENIEHFAYTLEEIKNLRPENVTFHALSIKRGAQLQDKDLTQDEIVTKMNDLKEIWCKNEGYIPYYLYRQKQITANLENIGYSLPGLPSIYNIQMMEERQTIWGLGVGACTKVVNPLDWTLESIYNPKDILLYNQRIAEIIQAKVDKISGLS